ncbi:MAG: hypothetical protein QXH55_02230 [Candidatus Korarchaeota archaeon]|nr:hypothetical protein [Thermoproteota archaeon]MCR8462956.1 hypothetical protein [Thermoproteota archaeon]MCR8471129.1 hypothetical protein [Thermoproteota archaeon]MCR8471422.1 hypothetical protein [Thermoproteota archaeon]MCR8473164.1 hypothetical protein [Thermoproteota archaeon]
MSSDIHDKLHEIANSYDIISLYRMEKDGEVLLYVLTYDELNYEKKKEIEKSLISLFEPTKCTVLFVSDLPPQHLKQMVEGSEIIFVRDKNLSDSILAGILTLSLDFQYLANEGMSLILRRKIAEALTSRGE